MSLSQTIKAAQPHQETQTAAKDRAEAPQQGRDTSIAGQYFHEEQHIKALCKNLRKLPAQPAYQLLPNLVRVHYQRQQHNIACQLPTKRGEKDSRMPTDTTWSNNHLGSRHEWTGQATKTTNHSEHRVTFPSCSRILTWDRNVPLSSSNFLLPLFLKPSHGPQCSPPSHRRRRICL